MSIAELMEQFDRYHEDVEIANNHQSVTNMHAVWSNHRTCYGSISIPSKSHQIATWTLHIEKLNTKVGYVCIGIDNGKCEHTDTWFYGNKQSANYGYECTGQVYAWGENCSHETKNIVENYSEGTFINMTLNTLIGTLEFAFNCEKCHHSRLQHTFIIEKHPKLNYNLAVSLKDAKVTICNFQITNLQNDENKMDENKTDHGVETEIKENKEDTFENVEHNLNENIKMFKKQYNEQVVKETYNNDTMEFLRYGSTLELHKNNLQNMIASLNSFKRYIENTQTLVNQLSSPNVSNYKKWNINTVIIWIGNLENGRYIKYLDALRSGFIKSEIITGEFLPDLDVAILSVAPFHIISFPDKRDLIKQFKTLCKSFEGNQESEGSTVHH